MALFWCDMSKQSIDECVRDSLETYIEDLRGIEPAGLYDLILKAVEKPMLELVMDKAGQNKSRAAQWLGLNRNTLRKKLSEHQLNY